MILIRLLILVMNSNDRDVRLSCLRLKCLIVCIQSVSVVYQADTFRNFCMFAPQAAWTQCSVRVNKEKLVLKHSTHVARSQQDTSYVEAKQPSIVFSRQ